MAGGYQSQFINTCLCPGATGSAGGTGNALAARSADYGLRDIWAVALCERSPERRVPSLPAWALRRTYGNACMRSAAVNVSGVIVLLPPSEAR